MLSSQIFRLVFKVVEGGLRAQYRKVNAQFEE